MAEYDFDRLSVLLVEDNNYVRSVCVQLLREFRVGHVDSAKDGADAIKLLKSTKDFGTLRGYDVIISDLIMSPIDGVLLLRWVRTSKESPNRFVPFIMLSGAADTDYVTQARDMGASEFLAKPFSAAAVYRHLLEIIDFPRSFIAAQSYFGPDRRRRRGSPPDQERRVTRPEDVTQVYSSERIVKPKKPTEVWEFHLPNRLREKVGGLGTDEPGEMPTQLLEQAEAELERASLDFTEWASGYVANLAKLCEAAREKETARRLYFDRINLLAHELRGQGGTFGYPLISVFGKMLYDATGPEVHIADNSVDVVKAHVDAMRAVLREKVSGDGGDIGRQVLASLQAAIKKFGEKVG